MTIRQRPDTLGPQRRTVTFRLQAEGEQRAGTVDLEARTCELAFSSETPCDMWYGTEILSMRPGAMRTGVRQQSLPLLFNHHMGSLLGVVERIWIDADRVARALVRFGKDEFGDWAMRQVADGVLVNVSFMYRVFRWEEDTEAETLTALEWEPYEISLVTVPADPSVGVGRSAATDTENGVQLIRKAAAVPASPTQSPSPHHSKESVMHRMPTHRLQEQADSVTSTAGGAVTTTTATTLPAEPRDHTRTLDVAQHHQRGAEAERARITEIEALCKRYDLSADIRTGMIQRGATIEQARMTAADVVMERAAKGAKPAADFGGSHNPDLSEREKARYSMIRAVNASLSKDWSKAGFELECSNEVSKRLGRAASGELGFFVPTNIPFASRATYTVGTPGAGVVGGTLVATNLLTGSFIEMLRNRARVMQLGATVLSGLVGAVDIPRQTGATSTFWTAEGVDTSKAEATFDKVSMNMKTIGTYSQITRNMLMQSTPDIDMLARADMIAQMALGIDLAALSGSGAGGQPLGIGNQAGVGTVIGGVNGAAITIDHYIDLETQVTGANAPEDSLAYLGNAKTVGSTKKLKSTTGQYLWTNAPGGQRTATPGEINGYAFARSNQARSTLTKGTANGVCSEVFFGAWSEVLIGEWGVLEIVPNPYDASVYKSGGVLLRALQSVDIGVRHAASFAVMSDALTP